MQNGIVCAEIETEHRNKAKKAKKLSYADLGTRAFYIQLLKFGALLFS